MAQHRQHDVIIVGGGHNGLVAAAYLAKAGLDVVLLEARHRFGGAVNTEELFPGARVSSCSAILHILQDKVVDDLDLAAHGLRTYHLRTKSFRPFLDGTSLLFKPSLDESCASIAQLSPKDSDGYRQWEAFFDAAGALLNQYMLDPNPPTVAELRAKLSRTENGELFERLLTGSVGGLLHELFTDDRVKAAVGNQVFPVGGSVHEPGNLIGAAAQAPARFVNGDNQGLPHGGMGAVTVAIAGAAAAAGAHLRAGAQVRRVLVENGSAVGVELADGQQLRAGVVVSNVDPVRTFSQLVDPAAAGTDTTERVGAMHNAYGAMKFHALVSELPDFSRWLGRDHDPKDVIHVGICPSLEYLDASMRDAAVGNPTTHPLISMQIPTVYDTSLTDGDNHIVSLWVRFAPAQPAGTTWDAIREREAHRLIDTVTEYAPNFGGSIIDHLLYTPDDMAARIGMTGGNIHHLSHVASEILGDRAFGHGGYRTPVDGLYLCGAGTHPGGEVSGAPGHNAAHAILADLAG